MTQDKFKQMVNALCQTVNACPEGAPSGVLYIVAMQEGFTLELYERMINTLIKGGVLRKEGDVLFATKYLSETLKSFSS